jgi:hypothetical protein
MLLLLLTAALYLPVRQAGLVYEDANWASAVASPFSIQMPGRGLSLLTLKWTRDDLQQAHAANVGLHLLNGLLVYGVAGWLAAIVFLVHPLNVEAVAYLAGRSDVLMTTGVLLAVLGGMRGSWVAIVVGSLLAATSKELGVIAFPLGVLAYWQAHGLTRRARVVLVLAGLAGAALAAPVAWLWFTLPVGHGGSTFPYLTFLGYQLIAVGRELALCVVPVGFTLDHDPIGLSPWWAVVALVAVVAGLVAVVGAQSSRLRFACVWMVLVLAPRLGLSSGEFIHESHWYVLMPAVCLVLGVCLQEALCATRAPLQPSV